MPKRNPETLEDARALLLENDTEIETLRSELETLRGQNAEKDKTIEDLRTLNQRYYLQLAQGQEEPDNDEPEPESLEEWAGKLKGVINV